MTHADHSEPFDALIGTVLAGKWRVESLLGSGGMARVYAAEHRNGHKVAIKVLNPELCAVPEARERFLREGYAANRIEHPGVVPVIDDDTTPNGTVFLVMERLYGRTLEARMHAPPKPSTEEILYVADRVLEVLERAHERGIIHRDIKPENLFLTQEGVVKVLDFGIARVRSAGLSGAGSGTVAGGIMGTPAYMAPEQARGRFDEVDGRSDVFALGVVMWGMFAGSHPRQATSLNEVLYLAMTEKVPSLRAVVPHARDGLVELVDRATAFERGDRWEGAGAMRAALARYGESLGQGPLATLFDARSLARPLTASPTELPAHTPSGRPREAAPNGSDGTKQLHPTPISSRPLPQGTVRLNTTPHPQLTPSGRPIGVPSITPSPASFPVHARAPETPRNPSRQWALGGAAVLILACGAFVTRWALSSHEPEDSRPALASSSSRAPGATNATNVTGATGATGATSAATGGEATAASMAPGASSLNGSATGGPPLVAVVSAAAQAPVPEATASARGSAASRPASSAAFKPRSSASASVAPPSSAPASASTSDWLDQRR